MRWNYYFIDFSKSFVFLPLRLLITNLIAYDFGLKVLKFIKNQMFQRNWKIRINESYNSWEQSLFGGLQRSGVPIGFYLFFFNMFLNELSLIMNEIDIASYADDSNLDENMWWRPFCCPNFWKYLLKSYFSDLSITN